jgi:hypothetical protein
MVTISSMEAWEISDYMEGGEGSDVYLFAAGDGNTTISNYDTSAARYDVLRFATGISSKRCYGEGAQVLMIMICS